LIESTGNTQGIRFNRTPPANAISSTTASGRVSTRTRSSPFAAVVSNRPGVASSSHPRAAARSISSISRRSGAALKNGDSGWLSCSVPSTPSMKAAAACSTNAGSATNHSRSSASSRGVSRTCTDSIPPSAENSAGQATGRAIRVSVAAKRSACVEGSGRVPETCSSTVSSAEPGMHSILHTSQSARSDSRTGPGSSVDGAMISTGSRSWPE
jgi:hypothetical protein